MLKELINFLFYTLVLFSLVLFDQALGNGFVEMVHRTFCKFFCFLKKTWRNQSKIAQKAEALMPVTLSTLVMVMIMLSLTMVILNKIKQYRYRDRIEDLLKESKEYLRQTNDILEKWRLRRIAYDTYPSNHSYLDEEPELIRPLSLEVPILHMAIIDTLGTARNQLERGDSINFTDSTFLSVTSFLDNDFRLSSESIPDEVCAEDPPEEPKAESRIRYLWDLMEEDSISDD